MASLEGQGDLRKIYNLVNWRLLDIGIFQRILLMLISTSVNVLHHVQATCTINKNKSSSKTLYTSNSLSNFITFWYRKFYSEMPLLFIIY